MKKSFLSRIVINEEYINLAVFLRLFIKTRRITIQVQQIKKLTTSILQ